MEFLGKEYLIEYNNPVLHGRIFFPYVIGAMNAHIESVG
jgi:hypothetical protein